MAITTFIPKIWDARLLQHLDNAHVFGGLVNRDYEGAIKNAGDTVKINQLGDIQIKDYTKNSTIAEPDQLTTTDQSLVIDQEHYFNFYIDDVDKAQALGGLMEEAMKRTSYGLNQKADSFLAKTMSDNADSNNKIGTRGSGDITVTNENILNLVLKMKYLLDVNNVQDEGRFIVVPPIMEVMLLSNPNFLGTGSIKSEDRLTNGLIGQLLGFNVYKSNNLDSASTNKYSVVASVKSSTTFAEQILKTEAYRPHNSFKDAIKGLHVYGAKVVQPKQIVTAYLDFTSALSGLETFSLEPKAKKK